MQNDKPTILEMQELPYKEQGAYHVDSYYNHPDFRRYIDDTVAFFDDKIGQTILNVGAGEGMEAELLLDKGHKVTLLDVSITAHNLWNERVKDKPWFKDIQYRVIDFLNARQSFDWVLMPNTLHMIEDEKRAVNRIKKIAKIGAYITVPDNKNGPLDLRGYSKERLEELFPGANIYWQHGFRWVIIWTK